MESYLPVIWAAIIGLAVAIYVIFDGFDLGIGILFPFAETERERDQMMNSVARSGMATRRGLCSAAPA
jgi:cytochrome bd ubiquinol oxidase subunit II